MTLLTTFLLIVTLMCSPFARSEGADNVVILLYHHVSDSTPPSTSVTPEVFEQHLQFLADGHNVISLERAVEALRAGEPLPERAVVITFDDGYRNIHDNAHPLLMKHGMPYTVFINPGMIGAYKYQLDWEQVRAMEATGARFATICWSALAKRVTGNGLPELNRTFSSPRRY